MLFNSYPFIFLFLPAAFIGMFWLGRYNQSWAAAWLSLASLTFYAAWDARFLLLLAASIAFNYAAAHWISGSKHARQCLALAIAANLMLLAYFKYANFLIDASNQLLGGQIQAMNIILPLGISFFTFTQIAFLVDVHRGISREFNFIHYVLFVTYFPHLIAGPVLHHKQMMPQFAHPDTYRIQTEHVAVGVTVFVLGLAKKVLIADDLADYATPVFNGVRDGQLPMLFEAWIGALAYTLQLYFDFSGYSDMAIGLSLMFNIRLPANFNSPYKATSIIEFWRRWHMTLSAFLRDYLYFSLGGNRKGRARRYINLMITMLLGGLWHGAGWTFIVWGGLHGFYLLINHAWLELKARLGWRNGGRLADLTAGLITFIAVVIAWVFFRADSFHSARAMLVGMAGLNGISLPESFEFILKPYLADVHLKFTGLLPITNPGSAEAFATVLTGLSWVWLCPNVQQIMSNHPPALPTETQNPGSLARWLTWQPIPIHAIAIALLFISCLDSLSKVSEFLYFRF